MSTKQAIILFISSILLGFLMILPFNLLCKATNWCSPIIVSYYLPKIQGDRSFEIFFEADNASKDVDFKVLQRSVVVRSGGDSEVEYSALNVSKNDIKIRPMPYVLPAEAKKYIKFYECLCFKERAVKSGEDIIMSVKFRLDRKIEKDEFFKENPIIRVGYKLQ